MNCPPDLTYRCSVWFYALRNQDALVIHHATTPLDWAMLATLVTTVAIVAYRTLTERRRHHAR